MTPAFLHGSTAARPVSVCRVRQQAQGQGRRGPANRSAVPGNMRAQVPRSGRRRRNRCRVYKGQRRRCAPSRANVWSVRRRGAGAPRSTSATADSPPFRGSRHARALRRRCCALTCRSSGDPLRQPPLGRSKPWCKLSLRGQAAPASAVALAPTLGSTKPPSFTPCLVEST